MESRLTTMYSWRWASLPIHTIYMSPRIIYADNRQPNLPGCKVALIREGDCTHACTHVRGDPLLPKSCHNQSMDLASVQRRGFQGTGKQTVRVLPCYTVLTTESESACTAHAYGSMLLLLLPCVSSHPAYTLTFSASAVTSLAQGVVCTAPVLVMDAVWPGPAEENCTWPAEPSAESSFEGRPPLQRTTACARLVELPTLCSAGRRAGPYRGRPRPAVHCRCAGNNRHGR